MNEEQWTEMQSYPGIKALITACGASTSVQVASQQKGINRQLELSCLLTARTKRAKDSVKGLKTQLDKQAAALQKKADDVAKTLAKEVDKKKKRGGQSKRSRRAQRP